MLLVGLVANLAVPLAYILTIMPIVSTWHNPREAGIVLLGLALVAAMPVAGSSTGWAQHSGGDMTLSLGLVLASTLLSPLTTPAAFRLLGAAAPDGLAAELRLLADSHAGAFLALWVLMPSIAGILVGAIMGQARALAVDRRLKPVGPVVLLLLCYTNACACLPKALGNPDWDFLAITTGFAVGLCVLTFTSGHLLGRLLGADREARGARLRDGDEQQRDGPGPGIGHSGLAAAGAVADHRLQPCATSGSELRQLTGGRWLPFKRLATAALARASGWPRGLFEGDHDVDAGFAGI